MLASRYSLATIVVAMGVLAIVYGQRLVPGQVADNNETARAGRGLIEHVKTLEEFMIPVGSILPFAGRQPPKGWLLCDGSEIKLTEKPHLQRLAAVIDKQFDPEHKTIRLPDMQGRTAIGSGKGKRWDGGKCVALTARLIGQYDGEETHVLTLDEMPKHDHDFKDPGHKHGVTRNAKGADNFEGNHLYGGKGEEQAYEASPSNTRITHNEAGKSMPHNNMQPFTVVNYIIKY